MYCWCGFLSNGLPFCLCYREIKTNNWLDEPSLHYIFLVNECERYLWVRRGHHSRYATPNPRTGLRPSEFAHQSFRLNCSLCSSTLITHTFSSAALEVSFLYLIVLGSHFYIIMAFSGALVCLRSPQIRHTCN